MKKILVVLGAGVLMLSALPTLGQTAVPKSVNISADGNARMEGVIKSTTPLVVTSWGGDWNIDTNSDTKFYRKNGGGARQEELRAGDMVNLRGTAAVNVNWTITASQIRDNSLEAIRPGEGYRGTIGSLASSTLVLGNTSVGNITVSFNASTTIYVNGQVSRALLNGMTANVVGIYNSTAHTLTASVIRAQSDTSIEGVIKTLDKTAKTMVVTVGQVDWSVNAVDARFIRKNKGDSTINEFSAGDSVEVRGDLTDQNAIKAKVVQNNSIKQSRTYHGVVTAFNATNSSFSLHTGERTIVVTPASGAKVKFNGKEVQFGWLSDGLTVKVSGIVNETANTLVADDITANLEQISGTVEGTPTATSLKIRTSSLGTWTVTPTRVFRRNGGASSLAEVNSGDAVIARVEIKLTAQLTVSVNNLRDESIEINTLSGKIASLDKEAKTFTITTGGTTWIVKATTSTTVTVGGRNKTFNDLANDMTATVNGLANSAKKEISANSIRAKAQAAN